VEKVSTILAIRKAQQAGLGHDFEDEEMEKRSPYKHNASDSEETLQLREPGPEKV
jgi:hypothetical protein